jgi:hypothetical protein
MLEYRNFIPLNIFRPNYCLTTALADEYKQERTLLLKRTRSDERYSIKSKACNVLLVTHRLYQILDFQASIIRNGSKRVDVA